MSKRLHRLPVSHTLEKLENRWFLSVTPAAIAASSSESRFPGPAKGAPGGAAET